MFTCTKCSSHEQKHSAKGMCQRCYVKAYHAKNRDKRIAYHRQRYWSDPQKSRAAKRASTMKNIDAVRARGRDWHRSNTKHTRKWRDGHRLTAAANMRAWRKANPEKCRARNMQSKAKRRQNEHTAINELFSRAEIYSRDKGLCWLCSKKVQPNNWHLDHIIPLSKGGAHTRTNVAVSHPRCNLSKGIKVIDRAIDKQKRTTSSL